MREHGPDAEDGSGGHAYQVLSRTDRFSGPVFSVVSDEVTMPGGGVARRDYARHVGAVAVVALDEAGRVVLIRQYRHPVGRQLWELPAGLIDVAGEDLPVTAHRELVEEADLAAGRLDLLVDVHPSPGFSDETVRIFLARDLTPVPEQDRHHRHDEEAELQVRLVDLDEAARMVLAGEITNGPAVAGLLAAACARQTGWAALRAVTEPAPRPPGGAAR
ncbi:MULTISPECIES: NUDIX domain-containing protein [Micromonosporaceae]|uniref:NUDIX domain-containing protein n=1 Tax=Micromonosporaceae TaxID=28056 RepID=UPI00249B4F00|nr:NUDIX hydrolase [Solwaraspora sp. WMMD937]WFE20048.1 NUDIX hydrolase [Solwaraspora sp. WMMD937]